LRDIEGKREKKPLKRNHRTNKARKSTF